MKKKIVILGSTGSIGKKTLEIINKDKSSFSIELLSTYENIDLVFKQAITFKVKKVIINNYESFLIAKSKFKKFNIMIYNNFDIVFKLFKKKELFYTMNSIVGLDGLAPTINIIKYTKNIAVVNKESLICGWQLINQQLKKNKTNFIPIDSEHFSIFSLLNNSSKNSLLNSSSKNIESIYLTASGGPFVDLKYSHLKNVSISEALKHPNWTMGKKISIDSATMMNKVFEVIEAKNIFNLEYKKIFILLHRNSYIHGIVKFNNGTTKLLLHDTDMKIPIHNSLYPNHEKRYYSKPINFDILNDLKLSFLNKKKFPLTKLLNNMPEYNSLYETALVTINDFFVMKFLKKKISYTDLIRLINKFATSPNFVKFKFYKVKNINDINKTKKYVLSKLKSISI